MAYDGIGAVLHPKGIELSTIVVHKVPKGQVTEPVLRMSILSVRVRVGLTAVTLFVRKPIMSMIWSWQIMPVRRMKTVLRVIRVMVGCWVGRGRESRCSGHGHGDVDTRQLPIRCTQIRSTDGTHLRKTELENCVVDGQKGVSKTPQ